MGDIPDGYVDTRGTRFGQAITSVVLLSGVTLREPILVVAVAGLSTLAVASGWRLDPYESVWNRTIAVHVSQPSDEWVKPASPHRFAKLLVALGTLVATAALVAGFPLVAYGLATLHGILGLAAAAGFCLACALYREFAFVRRLGIV